MLKATVVPSLLLLLMGVVGCKSSPEEIVDTAGDHPEVGTMPSTPLRFTSGSVDLSPHSTGARIRVATDGSVLFEEVSETGLRMLVVDSTGRERFRFGAAGAGPAELEGALPFSVTPSSATVVDLAKLKLLTFDTAGKLVGEVRIPSVRNQPLAQIDGDRALAMTLGPDGVFPAVIDLSDGSVHELMSKPDSFVESMGTTGLGGTATPSFGAWSGGLLIADPSNYRIALYDAQGSLVRVLQRDIPRPATSERRADALLRMFRTSPAGARASEQDLQRRKAELMEKSLDHFQPLVPLMTDYAGRLWVVGPSGDSAYADVFSSERHLGRIELPCYGVGGGWAVNGRWLAMSCEPDDPESPGDAVLKLFGIR